MELSITANGIPANIVPLDKSFLGLITRKTASVLAITKYSNPIPTIRCNVWPSLGLTIPNPKLTMITSILAKVLFAQDTTSAIIIKFLVGIPVELMF